VENYIKLPPNIPNGHEIYQMPVNRTAECKILQHLPLQNSPKFTQTGIFG
jgi:hypothetical protein